MLLEIRPGEGGEDAERFAQELALALRVKILKSRGRTLVAKVEEEDYYLPFVGTHRVQRVPSGERRGRRHTSTVTVALVPEERVEVDLDRGDVDIEPYRGRGKGGQKRNKVASAVRLRHKETGIVVTREQGRHLQQNIEAAMRDLRGRLEEISLSRGKSRQNLLRRDQIQNGERPVKTFTHNAQRDETVDHSTGRRWRMRDFLAGKIR